MQTGLKWCQLRIGDLCFSYHRWMQVKKKHAFRNLFDRFHNLSHLATHLRWHWLCNPSRIASYLAQMRSITSADALLCVGNVMPSASPVSR